ncbi:MAG: lamin tail domain-containing protein [Patescibacteria group bacterium]
MKHTYALGLLLALSVVPALSTARAAEPPSVVISEIAWAGSEKSTADEWIEIRNTGTETLDISGWSLTGVGTGGSAITVPNASSIPAGSAYLVANYSITDPKTTLITTPNLVTTAVSIPNTSLNVALLDSAGTVVDSLVDPGTPNFGSSTTFSTMKRDLSSKTWFTEAESTSVSHVIAAASATTPETTTTTPAVTDTAPPVVATSDPLATEVAEPIINNTNPVVAETSSIVSEPITSSVIDVPIIPDVATTPIEILVSEPSASEPPVVTIIEEAVPVIVSELIETVVEVTDPGIVPVEIPVVPIEEPVVNVHTPETLRITGLLSSPSAGNDEWVDLTNLSSAPVVLDTFTLVDASGKITALSGVLDAGATQRILNPNGNLNNDGDSLTLLNGDTVVDSLAYGTNTLPAPKKDAALLLVNTEWSTQDASSTTPSTDTAIPPTTIEAATTEALVTADAAATTPVATSVTVATTATPAAVATPEVAAPIAPSKAESSTPASSTVAKDDVVINEVLPSPSTGYDEWVELKNMKSTSLSLDGLLLIDASEKETHLSGTIDPGGYALIPNPTGNLNNDAESIALMNGNVVLDSVSYGNDINAAPKKDVALALMDGEWTAATPTPGTTNSNTPAPTETLTPTLSPTLYANSTTATTTNQTTIATNTNEPARSSGATPTVARHVAAAVKNVPTADSTAATTSVKTAPTTSKTTKPKTTAKKSSTSTKSSVRSITIDDIASIADGTKVKLEGIVVATAGLVGKRSFFLDGLEVYQSSGALADVKIGDHVSITGEVSVLSDHRRVNIQEDAVSVIDQGNPIVHDYALTLSYGSLVRISGTVSARDGNAVLLNTDHGTIKLVPGNGVTIAWADLAGATITATGILKHGDQETIILRSADDIVKQHVDAAISAATIAGTTASQSSLLWMTSALLAVGSAGFGAWVWYTRPKARTTKLILHPTNV